MIRFFVGPVIIGILAFSIVYFITPLLFSESDTVAVFAKLTLDLSNSVFTTMPPLLSRYLAGLNLLIVALTVAVLLIVAIDVLVIVADASMLVAGALAWIFKRKPKPKKPIVLEPLEMGPGGPSSRPGNKILGGGFDSLESD